MGWGVGGAAATEGKGVCVNERLNCSEVRLV